MKKILIAGIGNIFFGDDAFGCEAIVLLQKESLPDSVKLIDFGIRTRDLAFELCENYDLVILIDAVRLGQTAGTISLIQLEPTSFAGPNASAVHEAKLDESLNFAINLGAELKNIYLVGYEAELMEFDQKLSAKGRKMLPKAVKIIKNLLEKHL